MQRLESGRLKFKQPAEYTNNDGSPSFKQEVYSSSMCHLSNILLGLAPTSVLAGLFIFMGEQSLAVNQYFTGFSTCSHLRVNCHLCLGASEVIRGIHAYTALQIIYTDIIFYVTLTVAAPAFPVLIIVLVPIRLLLMNRLCDREILRFIDSWAFRQGTPKDDEDRRYDIDIYGADVEMWNRG